MDGDGQDFQIYSFIDDVVATIQARASLYETSQREGAQMVDPAGSR